VAGAVCAGIAAGGEAETCRTGADVCSATRAASFEVTGDDSMMALVSAEKLAELVSATGAVLGSETAGASFWLIGAAWFSSMGSAKL
jgi:hypothetical protein